MQASEIQSIKQRFGIIGNAPALNYAVDIAVQVAPSDLSVLITGESGVGKENFSKIIHQYSVRKHNPFLALNCGAIPQGTIESELFGHVKGAFTGATADHKGYFETLDGGTIFLDEIGEMPKETQAHLLRVLESGEFIRVGDSVVRKTNVRVVAATNVNLQEAIREGKFRDDLYYRLCAVPIYLPPLRERREDIPLLFRKFAQEAADRYNMPPIRLDDGARAVLCNYYWRGNIRQLKSVAETISLVEQERNVTAETLQRYLPLDEVSSLPAVFAGGVSNDTKNFSNEREILYQVLFDMKKDMNDLKKLVNDIMSGNIPTSVQPHSVYADDTVNHDVINITPASTAKSKIGNAEGVEDTEEYVEESLSLVDAEKEMIKKALERHSGNRKLAAADLGISERTLYRKLSDYDLLKK